MSPSCRTSNRTRLYKQFKMDEAWDGKNNAEWSKTVVRTFLSPDAKLPKEPEWGMTNYHGITGPGTVFETGKEDLVHRHHRRHFQHGCSD